jgi:hypothetical protein
MQRRANAFTTNCGEGGRGGSELEAARQGESGGGDPELPAGYLSRQFEQHPPFGQHIVHSACG